MQQTCPDLLLTLQRLEDLKDEDVEEDRPSDVAEQVVRHLLLDAARYLNERFPRASASVGPSRSIRLIWTFQPGEVRLAIYGANASKNYLYMETGNGESCIETNVSGEKIAAAILRCQLKGGKNEQRQDNSTA